MSWNEHIEQELRKATEGLKNGNEGLARVCARRAVAVAMHHWVTQQDRSDSHADAMQQLRRIQEHPIFPEHVKEAAQRLLTKVTEQKRLPMTTNPLTDAHIILDHLKSHI